jgi:serine-type D-Ala-D-Ala carboxypeptidase/endopeptidase (penicillin-binding protein 4)
MKQIINLALLIVMLGWQISTQAALPEPVGLALKQSGIAQDGIGVYVQSVDGGDPTMTHNTEVAMNPASVMKLVTTYAALETLGPAFRWNTEVYRDGMIENGVLKGNLIIKGHGDPSFKAQDFWRLLMRLQQSGIKRVEGNLIIDKSYFAQSVGERRTFDDETWRAYNAEPSAFLVNGRNTSFKFSVIDGQVMVDQEFELPEVTIINNMRLKKGYCGSWRDQFSYDVTQNKQGAIVTFTGKFAESCDDRYLELSVMSDTQYAFATFKKLWAELGGQFNGQLVEAQVPANALKLFTQVSEPLAYVIYDLNKWSINVMARQLLLTIAAEQYEQPATESLGESAVKAWLADKGLNFNELVIENGSGLSRIERISPMHLGQLLVSAYNSPVMPELIASMPILSVDGTMKKRLRNNHASGRAHFKTGSLNGVSAIAGYVLTEKNKRYVVVVMVNDARSYASKNVQDAIVKWIFEHY